MVGSVKRVLRKVLRNARLDFDEIHTFVVETEGILNSGPLTYFYEGGDNDNAEILTPSHLILGIRLSPFADHINFKDLDSDDEISFGKRFVYLIKVLSHFWARWRKEYICDHLEMHTSLGHGVDQVQVGDLVMISEDKVKQSEWKMGKVHKIIVCKDGRVRGAVLHYIAKGRHELLSRPLCKLYPLEVTSDRVDEERQGSSESNGRECW